MWNRSCYPYGKYHYRMVKNFVKQNENDEVLDERFWTNLIQLQSGQSIHTGATTYGVSDMDMKNMAVVVLDRFWKTSTHLRISIEMHFSEEHDDDADNQKKWNFQR